MSAGDEVDGDELHADHHRDNSLGVRGREPSRTLKFDNHGEGLY